MNLKQKTIFDAEGDDALEQRQLLNGKSTGIANLNSVKYKWAVDMCAKMQNNFWLPQKVSLVDDRVTLKELTHDEMESLKDTLSFLIALDSMQVANLPNLADYITAPEVSGLFVVQAYQEWVHSQSYQYILNELFPSMTREEIYDRWRTNPLLLRRNQLIADKYKLFIDTPTERNYKIALAADFVLEGIYFYIGFNFFYQLASRNKLPRVAKVIKYIENDEVTHVSFMNYLIKELMDDEFKQILIQTIMEATEQEIEWGYETYGDRILGISKQSTEAKAKHLANQRAKLLGLGVLYKGFNTDPYAHLETAKRENFFETTVTEYSQSTAVTGWDDF